MCAKSDAKWDANERKLDAINARIDNSYILIAKEIRSRKQGGN